MLQGIRVRGNRLGDTSQQPSLPTTATPSPTNLSTTNKRRRRPRPPSFEYQSCCGDRTSCVAFFAATVALVATLQLFLNARIHNAINNDLVTTPLTSSDIQSFSNMTTALQQQIDQLQRQISSLEAKQAIYQEDDRFFPFLIRDSRHLVPTQSSQDFHIFDYVDLSAVKQGKARHSQLFHNAHVLGNAPCQVYSVECYRHKILQVFDHVLKQFPHVDYYFYMEADNDLCVPMNTVQTLALQEERYFINIGIGFSGWIMSRTFMHDFLILYKNITFPPILNHSNDKAAGTDTNMTADEPAQPEIRPDVLASYYLTEKNAWAVTRQYWVSHTTLESLGVSSLTVKDRRLKDSGARAKLDKHLPRCLEPRRGKWPLGLRPLDPRDRFGWDYFDYRVCPKAVIFPCDGPDQLAKLVAEDWKIANETGAIAKLEQLERKQKEKEMKRNQKRKGAGTPK
ncbi:hypothetical protein IV203_016121 [Nitzschia inconspicua]|uniref:Uncharacterized protein n=1 Tax=Nitzschia inconspicua TaxID=303405 RepID=A0A9K3KQ16_9STRA|nr:hypothetical protein IV203_016121 [Nitzschia inconspicua]